MDMLDFRGGYIYIYIRILPLPDICLWALFCLHSLQSFAWRGSSQAEIRMGKMATFWSSELGFIDSVGLLMDQSLVFNTWNWHPFSHNHGAVENCPKWKVTILLEGPILHFHDHGRKGKWFEISKLSSFKHHKQCKRFIPLSTGAVNQVPCNLMDCQSISTSFFFFGKLLWKNMPFFGSEGEYISGSNGFRYTYRNLRMLTCQRSSTVNVSSIFSLVGDSKEPQEPAWGQGQEGGFPFLSVFFGGEIAGTSKPEAWKSL